MAVIQCVLTAQTPATIGGCRISHLTLYRRRTSTVLPIGAVWLSSVAGAITGSIRERVGEVVREQGP